jgi:hypothetical protein
VGDATSRTGINEETKKRKWKTRETSSAESATGFWESAGGNNPLHAVDRLGFVVFALETEEERSTDRGERESCFSWAPFHVNTGFVLEIRLLTFFAPLSRIILPAGRLISCLR